MSASLSAFLKYMNAWLLIIFALSAAIATEKCYRLAVAKFLARGERVFFGRHSGVRSFFTDEVGSPSSAALKIAFYAPAMAIASLVTVCASLPYCTFIPIIDVGSDVMQIVQFMILSEIFAIFSLYSLGSGTADKAAAREMKAMTLTCAPLAACYASLAAFFTKNGIDGDPLSLNSFVMSSHLPGMSAWGICGFLLFVFVILSQIPHRDIRDGFVIFSEGELPNFTGAPRELLQIWAVFRSFIVVSLVVYMLFPANMIAWLGGTLKISWYGQALNFIIFWCATACCRIVLTPLCRAAGVCAEEKILGRFKGAFVPALTVIAMLLLWYERFLLANEAAGF